MQQSILREFLDTGLFNFELDDPTFEKLEKAVLDLTKKELKKKTAIPSCVLAALDPNVDLNDPFIAAAKNHTSTRSNTILSRSKDSPVTLLRAVLLDALWKLAQKDIDQARIIWLIGTNVAPHYKLGREEKVIIDSFLGGIGQLVEKQAIESWKTVDRQPIVSESLDVSFSIAQANESMLRNRLKGAAGPFGEDGSSDIGTSPNGYWPNDNRYWVSGFAEKAAKGIALAINKTIEEQNEALRIVVQGLNSVINEAISGNQQLIYNGNTALKNRSQLLWWKEALYSQSMSTSYRELDQRVLPSAMAFDLYEEVTGIYPVSIDYFLKETLRKVILSPEKKSIKDLIGNVVNSSSDHFKSLLLPETEKSDSRETLVTFMGHVANNGYSIEKQLAEKVGIDPNTEIDEMEFAVWLFHELQALRICNSK